MVTTNSYRHTKAKPRFRVIIPTTQSMPPDVYRLLYDAIASKLEGAGYRVEKTKKDKTRTFPARRSGLDWGKRSPASLFKWCFGRLRPQIRRVRPAVTGRDRRDTTQVPIEY